MRIAVLVLLCGSCGLSAQDYARLPVEKLDTGFSFTEGPVWSRQGFLLFSDVFNNRIMKYVSGGGAATAWRVDSNGANGNTFDAQGRIYSCESVSRRVTRADRSGKMEVLAEKWEGKRLNAPNDIVVRRDGHIYFTDPAFESQTAHRELDFYGVYHIAPDGKMELFAQPKGRPNGIAFSPNGRILYVNNTDEHNVRAYDVDRAGKVSHERLLIADIDGNPDGMKVDVKGNLYITSKGVAVYTAAGKFLGSIPVPETPANCAFGDADYQTLYITARKSLYKVRLTVKGARQY